MTSQELAQVKVDLLDPIHDLARPGSDLDAVKAQVEDLFRKLEAHGEEAR